MNAKSNHQQLREMEMAALHPEEVGMSSILLKKVDQRLELATRKNEAPGVVALCARQGQVSYFKSFGFRSLEQRERMQKDDIFAIASMTKAITTVALMMLYEANKFDLDSPIAMYIPEFKHARVFRFHDPAKKYIETEPAQKPMNIRHLLTHTSGIGYPFLSKHLRHMSEHLGRIQPQKTLKENMPYFASLPLLNHPGAQWNYGYSTDILGHLIEVLSGLSLHQFFQQFLFNPLGMEDTFFHLPPAKWKRYTTRYARTSNGRLIDLPKHLSDPQKSKFLSGGGGLLSTAVDYGKFLQMLLNEGEYHGRRYLNRETVAMMTQNQIQHLHASEKEFSFLTGKDKFGLGFLVHTKEGLHQSSLSPGAYGWAGSYNTWYWVDPEQDLYGILLTQVVPFSDEISVQLYQDFQELIYGSIHA